VFRALCVATINGFQFLLLFLHRPNSKRMSLTTHLTGLISSRSMPGAGLAATHFFVFEVCIFTFKFVAVIETTFLTVQTKFQCG
jgi:hypothetical protein